MVPGPFYSSAGEEDEETSGSENETCLVAARLPGTQTLQSAAASRAARVGIRCSAGLEAADGNDLVS